jgi:hypothetical protein
MKILINENILLKEGISDIIYHFTDIDALNKILSSNQFRLSDATEDALDVKINRGYKYFLSTTNYKSNIGYASTINNSKKVRITLSGRKISHKYKTFGTSYDGINTPRHPQHPKYSYDKSNEYDESENRIVSKKQYINNALSYIERIDLLINLKNINEYISSISNIIKILTKNNIGIYFYDDIKNFSNQLKSIDISKHINNDIKEDISYENKKIFKYIITNTNKDNIFIDNFSSKYNVKIGRISKYSSEDLEDDDLIKEIIKYVNQLYHKKRDGYLMDYENALIELLKNIN